MKIAHYTIHCSTEGLWRDHYLPEGDPEPTTCPVDTGHTVTPDSVNVVETFGPNEVNIVSPDGSVASFPQTSAKTPIYQPSIVPPGYVLYLTGAFDDVATGARGGGALIALKKTDTGDTAVEGQFIEHVYILGGAIAAIGANYTDYVSMDVKAPASAPTDKTGTHDGNANKVSVGPFSIIVPAPLGDGDWDVDGAALTAGEINTDLVPIPSDGTGYWNWDPDTTPSITPVADPSAPDGAYNLFDAELPLARQANKLPCLIGGSIAPSALKGKKLLPHWVFVFTLHREIGAGSVEVACRMTLARKKTV